MQPEELSFSFPIAIYQAMPIEHITGRDGTAFTVYAGLTEEHARQLKAFSLDATDEAIQNNTSDRKRFGEGSYEEWYTDSRTPFSVVDDATSKLAALIWFGPKAVGTKSMGHLSADEQKQVASTDTGNGHTIAYRAYPPYRGAGIMKKAVEEATVAYQAVFPEAILWAIIDENNEASLGFAGALGYEVQGESKDGFVVMVKG